MSLVAKLLHEYLDARDAGVEPDVSILVGRCEHATDVETLRQLIAEEDELDELVDRYLRARDAGEEPSIDDYCRLHPDLAVRLREALAFSLVPDCDTDRPGTSTALSAGDSLGEFVVRRLIGRGAFGEVWEAEQASPRRRVALKVFDASRFRASVLARFDREYDILGTLDHPSIVPIYSAGRQGDYHFYAMKLLRGKTLAQVLDELAGIPPEDVTESDFWRSFSAIREGSTATSGARPEVVSRRSPTEFRPRRSYVQAACRILRDVAEALSVVHENGIFHRDLKPHNIIVQPDGVPVVLDFGLAAREARAEESVAHAVIGTIGYMSPEQLRGKRREISFATDVFSLGTIAYELLCLQRPFQGTQDQVARAIETRDPVPLAKRNPRVPSDLGRVVDKALEKNTKYRYPSGRELADDFNRFLNHEPVSAVAPNAFRRIRSFARRRPAGVLVAALLTIAVIALVPAWKLRSLEIERVVLLDSTLDRAREASAPVAEALLLDLMEQAAGTEHEVKSMFGLARTYWELGQVRQSLGVISMLDSRHGVVPDEALPGAIAFAGQLASTVDLPAWVPGRCEAYDDQGFEKARELSACLTLRHRFDGLQPFFQPPVQVVGTDWGRLLAYLGTEDPDGKRRSVALLDLESGRSIKVQGLPGRPDCLLVVRDPETAREELVLCWSSDDAHFIQGFAIDRDGSSASLRPLGRPGRLDLDQEASTLVATRVRTGSGGFPDIVAVSYDKLTMCHRESTGWVDRPSGLPEIANGSIQTFVVSGDFDGDGLEEVAVALGEWNHYSLIRVDWDPTLERCRPLLRQQIGKVTCGAVVSRGGKSMLAFARSSSLARDEANIAFFGRFRPDGISDGVYVTAFDPATSEFSAVSWTTRGLRLRSSHETAQIVCADLDGDGHQEIIHCGTVSPIKQTGPPDRIVEVFEQRAETLVPVASFLLDGFARIDVAQLDGKPGEELVVVEVNQGEQVVSVYGKGEPR